MPTLLKSNRITNWDPEDTSAWEAGNKYIARRNLVWSVFAEHVGFSIWSIWSVMVLFMPQAVYGFSAGDKFLLGATATLVGGCLRIPYTLATATFGGRNWTVFSAFVLLIPTVGTMVLLANPGLPLWPYLLCAALAGFGGGNFASSMTNINAFYPQRLKGWALGLNAGGGNIGVPMIQLVGLLVIATAGNRSPYWVCAVYLVALAVAGIGAALYMDNLEQHKIDLGAMKAILAERDTWVISLLYIGTFGSFIGFSFAFGQVLQINFAAGGQTAAQASLHAAQIAFIGPLFGSLSRVYGGKLADRIGGGRVTLVVFGGMILAAGVLVAISTFDDHTAGAANSLMMIGYVIGFIALFLLSGLGNGSVYKMIPSIFEARSHSLQVSEEERQRWSLSMSGALIGFAGAIGALGGVGINLALRQSYLSSGSATAAFWIFLAFYVLASVVTWMRYVRRPIATQVTTAQPDRHASAMVG
ncbi:MULTISPECIES: nitrate/nitrite transporter [unclassified Mycolicibacterium]|uniref:nitrate/nitrite transporter n=1 Tax=unclassified Mycolicibacterium TaxID=2636767 RepID=UPI0012DE79E0|nr:NarK/NasA family nitrate transporter [Mycolicibacterium sp. CBMA 329]MUL88922.1 NarK/NasA family nitrate transporter [Mycolicibacterium sp. CBMA 331]MUL97490.1 NarK/NasA family nitrate transporter [Mycolicibacterium sp. CBMA 334]MUM26785.1 NarK/NasA family nitrate transporter [Mycolicibacterium sp. CBMA 295]MUM38438.1 NarK/NasA family nitrate transporter [Mycolicibacterium sp. CBMA 247]MUM44986.1 NarK/NasA family nitrate transporter [Mycolicibacterium sp. CBMA 294]